MQKARTAGPSSPFRVVVPNRVDIAGGTLDIYPLYLLIGDAMTVNAAVAVRSEVAVRPFRRVPAHPQQDSRRDSPHRQISEQAGDADVKRRLQQVVVRVGHRGVWRQAERLWQGLHPLSECVHADARERVGPNEVDGA